MTNSVTSEPVATAPATTEIIVHRSDGSIDDARANIGGMRDGHGSARSARAAQLLVALAVTALVTGCGTSPRSTDGQSSADTGGDGLDPAGLRSRQSGPLIDARRFIARSNASIDESPGERIDLLIGRDTLRHDASCNEVNVAYDLADDVLYLSDIRSTTLVACFPAADRQPSSSAPVRERRVAPDRRIDVCSR